MDRHESTASDGLSIGRLKIAVNQLIELSIPYHLNDIRRHKQLIDKYRQTKETHLLLKEQISGSQSVHRLEADIRQLEELMKQINPSQEPLIYQQVINIKTNVFSVIKEFIETNEDFNEPLSGLFVDNEDQPQDNQNNELNANLQLREEIADRNLFLKSWQTLSKELVDLNEMFNSIVTTIKGQKERVDSIESNIDVAHENTLSGAQHLQKASVLKATIVPLTTGLITGAVMGPIGMLAGFKFAGIASAVGGGLLGYSGMKLIQKKSITNEEIELVSDNNSLSDKKQS
ncbi:syntaxin-17-like [Oppia nitens]|uniref:syntaxin-17-like n=1 Tax=Oppia nitens TaxID=1686743 RepID=UPI0023D9B5DB|nr:syntaxin-17-like [Oppia nitens]